VGQALKRVIGLLVICLAAGGIVYVTSSPQLQKQLGGGRRGKAGADEVVPVVAAAALRKDVPVILEGVGTARARNTVTIRPQVDGKILSINFREGQDVKKGDLLAKIDPATYQAQLDQAIAKKGIDEALLNNAKLDRDRYDKVGPNVVTQKQIDTQKALVDQYAAQIRSDEAAIANAQTILSYTDVVAPIAGRTGIRMVDVGNLVRAGDAGIVTITEVKPIAVVFTLPQQQLPQINKAVAAGPVKVEATDSDAKQPLDTGTLEVVDNQVDQTTGTVRLKAEFPNASLQLWPGQFVNVRVLVDTLTQVVVVPLPAVQRGPAGSFVFVVDKASKAVMRPVTVAQQTDTEVVIAKGLEVGETVVTNGFARLRDGSSVSISGGGVDRPAAERTSDATSATGVGTQAEAALTTPAGSSPAPSSAERRQGDRGNGEGRRRKRDASASP
jgi:multidrug efflux system membrane fusion protein